MIAGARRGIIRGRALDQLGRPLCDARIMISAASPSHRDIAQVTGPDGRFAFAQLSAGTYELKGLHDARGRAQASASISDGEECEIELFFAESSA